MSRSASKRSTEFSDHGVEANDSNGTRGTPTYKRRRVAIACTSCRNRKSRCNGVRPSCGLCIQLGFKCIYEQPANLQEPSVVNSRPQDEYDARLSSIEETLRLLVNQQTSPSRPQPQYQNAPDRLMPHLADGNFPKDVATLGEDENDLLVDSDDRVDGMATIAEPTGKDLKVFGPSSNIALLGEISKLLTASISSRDSSYRIDRQRHRLVARMPSPRTSSADVTPAHYTDTRPCALPSEPKGMEMVERFFLTTGTLFPFVSKVYILSTYQHARVNNYRGVRRSWLCLLNMIFAFATCTDLSGWQSEEKKSQTSGVYFNRAQDLLADSRLRLADLEIVQALVLMSQYRQGTQRSDETWSLHGLAVYTAMQIGLHRRVEYTGEMKEHQTEMAKRTWFACLALDSTLSMTLGRPPSIPKYPTQLKLPQPTIDERDRSVGESSTLCFFISTTTLYEIQNDIIQNLYGNNLSNQVDYKIEEALPDILKLESRLAIWEQHLEPSLKLCPWITAPNEDIQSNSVLERVSVIIRLRYLHARLLLHRATLCALTMFCGQDRHEDNYPLSSMSKSLLQQSLSSCLASAVEIIHIVHQMSEQPSKLGSAWFSIYYTFHATLILIKCLIVHFGRLPTSPELPLPLWTTEELSNATSALIRGRQAIARVGDGSRSSRRLSNSLSKMFGACIGVARASSEGATILDPLLPHADEMNQSSADMNTDSTDLVNPGESVSVPDLNLFDLDALEGLDFLSTFGVDGTNSDAFY